MTNELTSRVDKLEKKIVPPLPIPSPPQLRNSPSYKLSETFSALLRRIQASMVKFCNCKLVGFLRKILVVLPSNENARPTLPGTY